MSLLQQVQNNPSFHVIKAQCERQGGDLQSALASLNVAMDFIIQQKSKGQFQGPLYLIP